jgi:hypothetical protein
VEFDNLFSLNCFINSFKKPFFLVNTARGEVASIGSIVNALDTGQLRGACLDVLENEKSGHKFIDIVYGIKYMIPEFDIVNCDLYKIDNWGKNGENYVYLSGVQNIHEHSYKSYADALKHLNFMFKQINENVGQVDNIDMLKKKV